MCDGVPVHWDTDRPMLNVSATTDRLRERVAAGDMALLRADCPLEQTVAMLEAERKYTLNHYLRCLRCGRTVFYGLCIRGEPIYRHVEWDAPVTVAWERTETFVNPMGGDVTWH